MPRQLWNEGRVVGYSAYEVYLKHALSVDPDHEPATEKEWLASMMAMGSSMLLRIGIDPEGSDYDGLHYRDIQFPENCRLCAANTIMASFFDGEGYVGTSNPADNVTGWATKVTSYGPLIVNNPGGSPSGTVGPNGDIYPTNITAISNATVASRIKEYIKIVDGIIIQPGTWVDNPNKPPQKDFSPTLSEHPRLRIAFNQRITKPFFLLLTGFTNRSVVDGVTGFKSAVNTQSPADGDFLGPWAFPWANKVIFSLSSEILNIVKPIIGLNLDDKGHALSCYTTVDNETITALSMSDIDGTYYSLTGTSGTEDIKLAFQKTTNNVSYYEGKFNWNTLITMLHNNKSAKLKLEIKGIDPDDYVAYDITPVLLNREGDTIVSAQVKVDTIYENIQLKVVDSNDEWKDLDTNKYDGYFRMILKLNRTEIGTSSKFSIICCAFLTNPRTFANDVLGKRYDCGFYWRGTWNDVNRGTNYPNTPFTVYPIFGTSSVGVKCIEGKPAYKENNFKLSGSARRSMTAYANGQSSWGLNLQYAAAGIAGSDPHVILIDRSYSYGDSTAVTTIAGDEIRPGNPGYNPDTGVFKFKGSDGKAFLHPSNKDTRELTADEYSNLITYCAFTRDSNGVYYI